MRRDEVALWSGPPERPARSRAMGEDKSKQRSQADADLEREIREGRKFSLEEAIGRLAGPGAMKGVSPVPRMKQAEVEIESWLGAHLADAGCCLGLVLHRRVSESDLLLNDFEHPLVVLAGYCQQVLSSDFLLQEVVREADVEWGRQMGERPYFEKEGCPSNPDDPYTIESVHNALFRILEQLANQATQP
jgi:hypothetical protein